MANVNGAEGWHDLLVWCLPGALLYLLRQFSPTSSSEEEEIDIDLNDPEVQKAASKIQAGFRGHQVRKDAKDKAPEPVVDDDIADIDLTDPELADAALKIQAGFRGHLNRKKVEKKEVQDDLNKKMANLNTEEEEVLDIDLNDPDMEKAATKIQATFRGHKSRKAV